MQRAYMGTLLELAERDPRVLHLVADSGTGLDEMFRRNFPDRMLNFGIAESNMVGAAAGLAAGGKIPFVFTAGAFLCYRALEYIRDDVCFQNMNVKIVGMGSGLSWSSLGPTHHTTEDIGILRTLPNLRILVPATPAQAAECVKKAYDYQGPVYIRLEMNNEKEFFDETYRMGENGADILCRGKDLAIFSTGSILEEVMPAREELEQEGVRASVVNVHSLKPFACDAVFGQTGGSGLFCTVEEHNITGGLGSILSERMAEKGIAARLVRIGLEDRFAVGYGTLKQVRKENGLDSESIKRRILDAWKGAEA